MNGIGSHTAPNQGATDDWLTPPWIIDRLGPFDLDPCASQGQPWQTANSQLTVGDDGLARPWHGFVWCNPPYGRETWAWLSKLAAHAESSEGGLALIFARTETAGFQAQVWGRADAVLFLAGRLFFHRPVTGDRAPHNSGGPSALVAYGQEASDRLKRSEIDGALVSGWSVTPSGTAP